MDQAITESGVAHHEITVTGSQTQGFIILAKKGAEAGTDPNWTHWKYGPEGNATSKDEKAGPPTHVKWVSGDEWMPEIGPSSKPGWRFWKGKAVYHWNGGAPRPGPSGKVNHLVMRDANNGHLKWTKEDLIDPDGWLNYIYINDKIYYYPKPPKCQNCHKMHHPEKELAAINEEGEEILHWNLPDKFKPDYSLMKSGKGVYTDLMIVNDKMIVTMGNNIIALNPEKSNEILWSVTLPQTHWPIGTIASAEENKVFFIVSDMKRHFPGASRWIGSIGHVDVRALNLDDGSEVWRMDKWGEAATDSLYGIGQLVYDNGKLFVFHANGGSLSADQRFYTLMKDGSTKKGDPYTAMYGAIDTKTGNPLWMRNWGLEYPYYANDGTGPKKMRPRSNNALIWNDMFIEYRNGAYTEYEPSSGKWKQIARDTDVIGQRLGIPKGAYNPSGNNRCARATASVNYLLGGYVVWYDKQHNYDFKPVRRSACAAQVYPVNGMTYYSPSGCQCYNMVNSKSIGLNPGANTKVKDGSHGGRGFIALGNLGTHKIIASDWRLDQTAKITEGNTAKRYPTSIRVLKKPGAKLGPILSDWPENRMTKNRTLAKKSGWDQYSAYGYQFQSMGSMMQVQVKQSGQVLDHIVMGGRLAVPPVVQGNRVYLGSKDGYVYAYDLSQKKLAWKFLAAPNDKRIVYASQLESHWPVNQLGIKNGRLFLAAGRHTEVAGLFAYELDLESGDMLKQDLIGGKGWSAFGKSTSLFEYAKNETRHFTQHIAKEANTQVDLYRLDGKRVQEKNKPAPKFKKVNNISLRAR